MLKYCSEVTKRKFFFQFSIRVGECFSNQETVITSRRRPYTHQTKSNGSSFSISARNFRKLRHINSRYSKGLVSDPA